MADPREPGWYFEPESDRVERFWDSEGPTDEVRFWDPQRSDNAPRDPVRVELDLGKHPYRRFGLRWWLQMVPSYPRYLFIHEYQRGRDEAIEAGELKRLSLGWRIVGYVVLVAFGLLLLIDKVRRTQFP